MNPLQLITQMMSQGNNPQTIINQLMSTNPNAGHLINQMQQSGLSPRDFAMQYARQNGKDINSIINTMSQFGVRLK